MKDGVNSRRGKLRRVTASSLAFERVLNRVNGCKISMMRQFWVQFVALIEVSQTSIKSFLGVCATGADDDVPPKPSLDVHHQQHRSGEGGLGEILLCHRLLLFGLAAFFVPLLALTSGCAPTHSKPNPNDVANSRALFLLALNRKFPLIEDQETSRYLQQISSRIAAADQRCRSASSANSSGTPVYLVNSERVFAVTDGLSAVVLSRGLIRALRNEAELAFIIAHESAHIILAHGEFYTADADSSQTSTRSLDHETEADSRALGCLGLAGYDLRAALGALKLVYAADFQSSTAQIDSEGDIRFKRLKDTLLDSNWRPPGTVNRREFKELQARTALIPG